MTTKRKKRPGQDIGLLKTCLLVGTIAAALAGTRLLALNDKAQETAVPPSNTVILQTLPPTDSRDGTGQAIILDLKPVPQAVTPNIRLVQPVARSKTS